MVNLKLKGDRADQSHNKVATKILGEGSVKDLL